MVAAAAVAVAVAAAELRVAPTGSRSSEAYQLGVRTDHSVLQRRGTKKFASQRSGTVSSRVQGSSG